jgi:hypothetical protein
LVVRVSSVEGEEEVRSCAWVAVRGLIQSAMLRRRDRTRIVCMTINIGWSKETKRKRERLPRSAEPLPEVKAGLPAGANSAMLAAR